MSSSVSVEQLRSMVYGACFLASGGGGPISMALNFLDKMSGSLPLLDVSELASVPASSTDQVLILADMGSPDAAAAGHGYSAPVNVFTAMQQYLHEQGIGDVAYLLAIELGAVNSLIPFYISSQLSLPLPVLDADPSGRSVPQLNETLLDASGQAICPAAVASDTQAGGGYVSQFFFDEDATTLEDETRQVVSGPAYQQVAGLACYPLSAHWLGSAEAVDSLVPGSLSLAMKTGDLLLSQQSDSGLGQLLEALGVANYCLFDGTLSCIDNRTAGGFDVGKLVFTNMAGAEFWVYYKNESLLAWDPVLKQPHVMAPDCINLVLSLAHGDFLCGSPLSTADVVEGMACHVWGTACSSKMRSQRMETLFMANIQEILAAFPDDGVRVDSYISIEALNG
jgi:uncharacterized protein